MQTICQSRRVPNFIGVVVFFRSAVWMGAHARLLFVYALLQLLSLANAGPRSVNLLRDNISDEITPLHSHNTAHIHHEC